MSHAPLSWLITGAGGQLGSVICRHLIERGESVFGLVSPVGPAPSVCPTARLDLADHSSFSDFVARSAPTWIIHTAAITSVQVAFDDPVRARRINVDATLMLTEAAFKTGARLVYVSTDLVFDGQRAPYSEDSRADPLSIYGRSKLDGEASVRAYARGVIARVPLMYGLPDVDRPTTFRSQLKSIQSGTELRLFEDEYRTPLWLEDAADACIRLARSDMGGIFHLGGPQRLSRLEMGRITASGMGKNDASIVAIRRSELASPEPRPCDVSLTSNKYEQAFGCQPGRPMTEAMSFIRERLA